MNTYADGTEVKAGDQVQGTWEGQQITGEVLEVVEPGEWSTPPEGCIVVQTAEGDSFVTRSFETGDQLTKLS